MNHTDYCASLSPCCPNDEYGCPIHIPNACNCGIEEARDQAEYDAMQEGLL